MFSPRNRRQLKAEAISVHLSRSQCSARSMLSIFFLWRSTCSLLFFWWIHTIHGISAVLLWQHEQVDENTIAAWIGSSKSCFESKNLNLYRNDSKARRKSWMTWSRVVLTNVLPVSWIFLRKPRTVVVWDFSVRKFPRLIFFFPVRNTNKMLINFHPQNNCVSVF